MVNLIKPKFDGTEMVSSFYDGPMPKPGPYRGTIKKMGLAKIGSGENQGEDRIALVVEIGHGEFKGAGIVHSLNIIPNSGWSVNQFLDALTDGSDRQKKALRKLFWTKGYEVEKEPDGKMGRQFVSIGGKFKPLIGRSVAFVVKKDYDASGEEKAAIDRFIVPVEDGEDDNDDALESSSSEDSADDGFAGDDDDDSATETKPEENSSESEDDSDDDGPTDSDDDDDDPWS